MNILITGGCGYVGTVLTNFLIQNGHNITVIDNQWFGNYLKKHSRLKVIKKDIREIKHLNYGKIDALIHLANIANDPGVELNPSLSWDVNVLSSHELIKLAIKKNIKQFIYASSGSVYGIKKEKKVTETLDLLPISTYNKTKMIAEKVLMSFANDIKVHCIRPATVCGWSPRMRLDVNINMLTFQALHNKLITVFGGKQIRPNIHINDMVRVYDFFLRNPKIESGFYNAGKENIKILEVANLIIKKLPAKIKKLKSNDLRSYRLSSEKLESLGFKYKFEVNDAIDDLIMMYKKGMISDNDKNYTVKWMKKLNL